MSLLIIEPLHPKPMLPGADLIFLAFAFEVDN